MYDAEAKVAGFYTFGFRWALTWPIEEGCRLSACIGSSDALELGGLRMRQQSCGLRMSILQVTICVLPHETHSLRRLLSCEHLFCASEVGEAL